MNFLKKGKKNSIFWLYSFGVPYFLIFISLSVLSFITYQRFFSQGNFTTILVIYSTTIALTGSLASISFSYSKTKKDDEEKLIIQYGELFLYASLALISALLISWLSFETKNITSSLSFYKYIKYPIILIFTWGQTFLFFAANSFHAALMGLETFLWFKVKDRVR